jgi:hypothetical protein
VQLDTKAKMWNTKGNKATKEMIVHRELRYTQVWPGYIKATTETQKKRMLDDSHNQI